MYTFNLGFVMGQVDAVVIIVCASQDPIEIDLVKSVAGRHFMQACSDGLPMSAAIKLTADGIKAECQYETVIVSADSACFVPVEHR